MLSCAVDRRTLAHRCVRPPTARPPVRPRNGRPSTARPRTRRNGRWLAEPSAGSGRPSRPGRWTRLIDESGGPSWARALVEMRLVPPSPLGQADGRETSARSQKAANERAQGARVRKDRPFPSSAGSCRPSRPAVPFASFLPRPAHRLHTPSSVPISSGRLLQPGPPSRPARPDLPSSSPDAPVPLPFRAPIPKDSSASRTRANQ